MALHVPTKLYLYRQGDILMHETIPTLYCDLTEYLPDEVKFHD